MAQNQQGGRQDSSSPRGDLLAVGRDTSNAGSDEWSDVKDPNERRKIQNKLAQRRYRHKAKEQKEEGKREAQNQQRAANSYAPPEPGELDSGRELSGLPWGGISIQYIMESGRSREQSQRSPRENSVYAAASSAGGSSRVGLHLTNKFARGYPVWRSINIPQDGIASDD